jgi:hypothetical protein
MVGAGALIECLADPRVTSVLAIGRHPCGVSHPRLREIIRPDPSKLADLRADLAGHDACFFCLGVSSVGMDEASYTRITHDLTLAVATTLAELNPAMTFCYISGQGTDGTERGRLMWARVKGRTENALLKLPFKAYMLRPGYIQPLKGVRSKTAWYQAFYNVMGPLYPVVRRVFPGNVTTTVNTGRAMIALALRGYPGAILENRDINRLAEA